MAVHHSSQSVEWSTPQAFFDKLNATMQFTLDPAATAKNAKCATFYTKRTNGLTKDWGHHRVWLNPPYGNPEHPCKHNCKKKKCAERGHHNKRYVPGIADWVKKAHQAANLGATVVCLLPARTDTDWWHRYIWNTELASPRYGVTVDFVKGRLAFGNGKNPAPFPCVLVTFMPPTLPGFELEGARA